MAGVQRWRRRMVAVAITLAVPSVSLVAAPASAAGGPPALEWPEVAPAIPTEAPQQEGALAVPDDWSAPVPQVVRRAPGEAPVRARELVERRGAAREVWENTDGTESVTIHTEPIFFQPDGSQAWEPIDTTLVADPDRPGWLRNAAGGWIVRFAAIQPGAVGGMELETEAGPIHSVPDLAEGQAAIVPVVGGNGPTNSVTYADVWPGADLRYTVGRGWLAQEIVIRHPDCESFRFLVEGLGLVVSPAGLDVTGAQASLLRLQPIEVTGPDGKPSDRPAQATMTVREAEPALVGDDPDIPGTPQDVELVLAGSWLDRSLATGQGPVVLGATTTVGPPVIDAHRSIAGVEGDGGRQVSGDGLRIGHQPGDPASTWRSVAHYDYWADIQGKQLLQAQLLLTRRADRNPRAVGVTVRNAIGGSFDGAAGDGTDWAHVDVAGATDATADVTDLVTAWQRVGWPAGLVGVVGDESTDTDGYVRFGDTQLVLTVNSSAPPPALLAPAPQALAITSTTPTLSWSPVTDPDGDQVAYVARIATGSDADSGLVATSPAGPATSWAVPPGLLRDGVTYSWKVLASDGRSWTPSEIRTITVDRRAGSGTGPTAATDVFGGVTTNLVTGNATIGVDGPELPSVDGGVGVRITYSSQAETTGLVGTYREDADQDTAIDATDPVRLVRTDAQLSFDWSPTSPTPAPSPGVPSAWFSAQWAGSVALPPGSWQLGARVGDGVRIRVDGDLALDKWVIGPPPAAPAYQDGTIAGNSVHEIGVDYFQASEGAAVELWARNADDPVQEFIVPAAWLSPSARVLPTGWSLQASGLNLDYARAEVSEASVTLYRTDGSALAFTRTSGPAGTAGSAAAYTPPAGVEDVVIVNADGTVTVQALAGRTYVFRPSGGIATVTTAADDRNPRSATSSYDGRGRLEKLTDPVSGRSVRLTYAPADACAANPPFAGATGFDAAPTGMVCRIDYWDGTATELYYRHGLLAYVRNPGDAYWGFGYDAAGRLGGYVEPLGFDAAMAGVADGATVTHQIGYDDAGRAASVARPGGVASAAPRIRTYTYAPASNPSGELAGGTASVARRGLDAPFRSIGYDARARLISDTNAAGETTRLTWDADDRVAATDAADGLRTTTIYNRLDQPTDTWGPAPAAQFDLDGSGQDGVPRQQTHYDEGLDGQQVRYWNNVDLAGRPTVHGWQPGTLSALNWDAASPVEGVVGADGWSARFTGKLVFPTPGEYRLQIYKDDKARVFLDDRVVIDEWTGPAGWSAEVPFTTTEPDETHRLRVDFAELTGPASMQLVWIPPGGATRENIPDGLFKPDFRLATSMVDPDGATIRRDYVDQAGGIGPQHRLEVQSVVDPGGLNLTESTGYEPVGTGLLRQISRVRPAGPDTKTTVSHYGDREDRDNPCTRGADPANQAGLVKLDSSADPDGAGPGQPLVREVVYDRSGRVVAARVVGDDDWTCTSYDDRGRVVDVRYPAFGDQAARTVTHDYTADPDGAGPLPRSPLVTAVSDEVGTVITASNVLGEPTSITDVFGNRTTITYDDQGREVGSQSPVGTITRSYDDGDRLTGMSRDGQALVSDLLYDAAGRLMSVSYPAGAGNAGMAGNGTAGTFGYDALGRAASVTWIGSGGAVLFSDEVTRRLGGAVVDQKIDGIDHHPGDDYGYDAAGRLLEAWVPGRHISYQFAATDGCGPLAAAGANSNRTHQLIEGGPVTCYCYDRADRLVAADTAIGTISYDAHSNATGIFGEIRRYDSTDRHVETVKDATRVVYRRDAHDRIVERQVNGTVSARYGAGFTTDANNAVLAVTVDLPGGAHLNARPEANVWSYPTIRGDIAAAADQSGAKLGPTVVYDPFGNLVSGEPPDNAMGTFDDPWVVLQRVLHAEIDAVLVV